MPSHNQPKGALRLDGKFLARVDGAKRILCRCPDFRKIQGLYGAEGVSVQEAED